MTGNREGTQCRLGFDSDSGQIKPIHMSGFDYAGDTTLQFIHLFMKLDTMVLGSNPDTLIKKKGAK